MTHLRPFLLLCILLYTGVAIGSPVDEYKQNFFRFDLGSDHIFKAPLKLLKSKNGQFWYFFNDHILVKDGRSQQKLSLSHLVKKTKSTSVRLEVLELDEGILFARAKKLFYVSFKDMIINPLPFAFDEYVMGLSQSSDDTLWLVTFKGVYRSDSYQQPFTKVTLIPESVAPADKGFLALSTISSGKNRILVSTAYSTIIEIDTQGQNTFKARTLSFKGKNSGDYIYTMVKSDDELYLGARYGLYRFNLHSGQRIKLDTHNSNITAVRGVSISGDTVWFVANGRLHQTDKQFSFVSSINSIDDFQFDRSSIYLTSLYSDNEDNTWFGVQNKGLFQYNDAINRFNAVHPAWLYPKLNKMPQRVDLREQHHAVFWLDGNSHIPSYQDFVINEEVLAVAALDENQFWYGSYNKLALIQDGQEIKKVQTGKREVTSIALNGDWVWYTRAVGGLFRYSPVSDITESINYVPLQQMFVVNGKDNSLISVSGKNISRIEDNAATQAEVLFTFKHDAIDAKIDGNQVTLYFDNGNVSLFDLERLSMRPLPFAKPSTLCMVQQQQTSNWWLAQNNGSLLKYNENNQTYQRFDEHDGLPKGGVNGLLCGHYKGRLIFSTASGLFTVTDKLDYRNQQRPMSSLYFGSSKQDKMARIDTSLLAIHHDSFPLRFGSTNSSFQQVDKNQVQYKLQGQNDQWIEFPRHQQSKEINYLPEGNYILQSRVSNNHGIWSAPQSLSFEVLPPIWLTLTAKISYFILFVLLFAAIYLYRTRTIRARAIQLEKTVAEKTQQISTEKRTVEKLLAVKEQEFIHVSHELRTPLTLITGPLKAARNKTKDPQMINALDMATRNGERLHRMVDQLLHLERFKFENVLAKVSQNISQILTWIIQSFQAYAAKKDITIEFVEPPECFMAFVPDAFDKICINLLSNAVKYSNNCSHIKVTAIIDKDCGFTLTIADSGIGIAEKDLPHVFEKFYRVDDQSSESGAGVGLALVKTLVENHHGTISLTSRYGEGTTVTVHFPAELIVEPSTNRKVNKALIEQEISTLDTEAQSNETSIATTKTDEEKLKLLIIEDTKDMRELISNILTEHYQCQTAVNGKEGLKLAQSSVPDLIICDVMMPMMDGFEVTKRLKENETTSHIPIILLTARGDKDSRLTGWKSLADDYIAKPFDPQELIIRTNNLISLRKLLQQRFSTQLLNGEKLCTQAPEKDQKDNGLNEKDAAFVDKVTKIINDNLHEESFSTEQLADQVFMSDRQLQRKLKALIDFTPREYLQHLRLIAASELLLKGERVTDVSMQTGFSSSSYFTRCFKAKYNMTPKQYAAK